MRFWVALALAASSGLAHADRLIYIPTARKIPFMSAKYEFRAEPRVKGDVEHYLGLGLTTSWELELRSQNHQPANSEGTFDLTYNYLSPLTNLTPGFAFGVQDVLSKTAEGPRPFAVVTFRQGFFAIGGEYPADLTLGVSVVEKRLYPIVGATIPFSGEVRLLAEHDGLQISAGLQVQPIKQVALRFIVREKNSLFGLMIQHKF